MRRARPEPERRLAAGLVRLHDMHSRDAAEHRGLQAHQPDGPGPDDDRVLDGRVAREAQADGVHPVGQGLGEGARARRVFEILGERVGVAGGDARALGEAAGVVDADKRAPGAEVRQAHPAQAARLVRLEGVDRDDAPDEALVHARAHPDDGAGELVAHYQGRGAVAHLAQVPLDLRAADARGVGAHDQHPLARGRLRHLLDGHPLRPLPHDGFHKTPDPFSPPGSQYSPCRRRGRRLCGLLQSGP